jgi:hypothetical protein
MDISRGLSSLLLFIPTFRSIQVSNSLMWKVSNASTMISSFLCNSHNYSKFLLYDYFSITSICISYINHNFINSILLMRLLQEYKTGGSIELTKNISFGLAVSMSMYHNYIIKEHMNFTLITFGGVGGAFVYCVRYYLYKRNITKYNMFLTTIWHACSASLLYGSSHSI